MRLLRRLDHSRFRIGTSWFFGKSPPASFPIRKRDCRSTERAHGNRGETAQFCSRLARARALAPSLFAQPFSGTTAALQVGFSEAALCRDKHTLALARVIVLWRPFPISHCMAPMATETGNAATWPTPLGIGQTVFQSPPMPQKTSSGPYCWSSKKRKSQFPSTQGCANAERHQLP